MIIDDGIVPAVGIENKSIFAHIALQYIVTLAAVENIVAVPAIKPVITFVTVDRIFALASVEFVVTLATADIVFTAHAVDGIVAAAAVQTVVTVVAGQSIVGIVTQTVNILRTGQRKVFNIIRQNVADIAVYTVRTAVDGFIDFIRAAGYIINIVCRRSLHGFRRRFFNWAYCINSVCFC